MLICKKGKCLFIVGVLFLSFMNTACSQGIADGGIYKITARHSGKVLEVLDGSTDNGANIQQAAWTGEDKQKWRFTDAGDGCWRISPLNRTSAALRKSVNNVEMRSYADEASRQWRLIDVGGGYYQISAKDSGDVVTIDGVSVFDGANASVQVSDSSAMNQQFKIESASTDFSPKSTGSETPAAAPVATPSSAVNTSVLLQASRPRVIATTDGELDDKSSMVRFLMYASDYDIAGIVQVNGVQKDGHSKDKWIEKLIDQYDRCLPNLRKHCPDYPDAAYLLSVLKVGNENRNDLKKAPPLLSDSEGAQLIIKALLDGDPRPVHILSWGGANTTANALWQIKDKYSPEEYQRAAAKARLYCIWYQDGGGQWIEDNLPEVKIYEAGADPHHDGSWRYVWDYMSVDLKYKGRMSKNPKELQEIMDTPWLMENIKQGHGPLAAAYPQDYTSEGDTPSFMPLINNGLNQHMDYTLGGWGGRAVYKNGNHMVDGGDENNGNIDYHYTFQRWLPAAQNDWAARADWCVADSYSKANHQPVAAVKGKIVRDVTPGQTVVLDASPSTDPDKNALSYNWWQYHEADSVEVKVEITNADSQTATFVVPDEPGKQVFIILEVTDDGTPALTNYQRVFCNIQ